MKERPRALAMIICDDVIEDKRSHKKTLIGIFNQITAKSFPARHPKMVIFLSLTNGFGKYQAMLRLSILSELKVINEIKGELEFASPNDISEYTFELLNVAFPEEGKYSFELWLDGEPLTERVFEVARTE